MGVVWRLTRWAAGLVLAVLAVTVAAVLYFSDRNLEVYGGGRALAAPVDAVIVLGGGVDGDGVIGFSSRRRVKEAVALLAEGKARRLILSGGPANASGVARLMRDHAVELGAPAGAVLVEDRSVSTFENVRFSLAVAEARELERLAILTDSYHLERAWFLARYFGRPDMGLVAVSGLGREGGMSRALSILREALAWWYNLGKIVGWEGLAAAGLDAERQEWIR